jgi:hypothetical protein
MTHHPRTRCWQVQERRVANAPTRMHRILPANDQNHSSNDAPPRLPAEDGRDLSNDPHHLEVGRARIFREDAAAEVVNVHGCHASCWMHYCGDNLQSSPSNRR